MFFVLKHKKDKYYFYKYKKILSFSKIKLVELIFQLKVINLHVSFLGCSYQDKDLDWDQEEATKGFGEPIGGNKASWAQ